MHDRRVLGWGWAAGSPVHVSACHWIKVAVRWKYVPKRRRLRSRAVLVVRRCRLRQKYLNVFVEAGSCLTGADFGGRRWIGGAGSSRRHGCHRRGRFFFSHRCARAVRWARGAYVVVVVVKYRYMYQRPARRSRSSYSSSAYGSSSALG